MATNKQSPLSPEDQRGLGGYPSFEEAQGAIESRTVGPAKLVVILGLSAAIGLTVGRLANQETFPPLPHSATIESGDYERQVRDLLGRGVCELTLRAPQGSSQFGQAKAAAIGAGPTPACPTPIIKLVYTSPDKSDGIITVQP